MSSTRSETLAQILHTMLDEHNFSAAVLTGSSGLPLASAQRQDRELSNLLAAIAPVLEQAAQRTTSHTEIDIADEIVIRGAERSRVVCRFFQAGEQPLILAAIVPPRVTYRRTMNQAIRAIRQAW